MKLSILICSLYSRHKFLDILLHILDKQKNDQVEILVEKDNGKTILGAKRNLLLEKAQGQYICFVDDDDKVSKDYISKILEALKTEPDCCGIEGIIFRRRNTPGKLFIHSIKYNTWFEEDGIYYRCPNHLNPVKREIALQIGFPEKNSGEDHVYSNGIFPLLKTEVYIKGSIYYYLTG